MGLFGQEKALLRTSTSRNALELFPIQRDALRKDRGLMAACRPHQGDLVLGLGWLGNHGWKSDQLFLDQNWGFLQPLTF